MRFLAPFFTCTVSEQVQCVLAQRHAGSFAIFAAIRRASSLVSNLAADRAAWAVAVARLFCNFAGTHLDRPRRLPAARSTKHEFIFRSLGPGVGQKLIARSRPMVVRKFCEKSLDLPRLFVSIRFSMFQIAIRHYLVNMGGMSCMQS
jgi:hypothetical protein